MGAGRSENASFKDFGKMIVNAHKIQGNTVLTVHIVQMEGVMRLSFAPNMTGQAVRSQSLELKTKERNEFRRGKLIKSQNFEKIWISF